jgi:hypothetical protein
MKKSSLGCIRQESTAANSNKIKKKKGMQGTKTQVKIECATKQSFRKKNNVLRFQTICPEGKSLGENDAK